MAVIKKQRKNTLENNNHLFFQALFYRPFFRFFILILSLAASICSFLVIYFQKSFIDSILKSTSKTNEQQLYFILMLSIFAFSSYVFIYFNKRISYFEASKIQRILAERTYSKTLSLTVQNSSKTGVGNVISLYTTDVLAASTLIDDAFPNLTSYIMPICLAPIALIFLTSINPTWIFFTVFTVLLVNCLMAIRQTKFFINHKFLSAIRMEFVNEWLQNIRTIRMLGWMKSIENKIWQSRINETKNRLNMVTNGSVMNSIAYSTPFFINILAIFLLIFVERKNITPGEIFSLLWVFGVILTRPIRMFPMTLVTLGDCYTSFKRLEEYYNLESEAKSVGMDPLGKTGRGDKYSPRNQKDDIAIKNLNLSFDGKQILKNINLKIKQGEFVAIVGAIGAGKTSLLQSLLKLYPAEFDQYRIGNENADSMDLQQLRSRFSYVPQDFFVTSSNLRDNIALDYDTEEKKDAYFLNSLRLCQFKMNQENQLFTLETEIGERGVNLSGGQKQRVTLARAHYFDRDIILLDDCLSALDVHTEEKINQTLLNGAWKNKTRILVTHRLSILPECDRVLFMQNGEIVDKKNEIS
jgi:ABC-type multidrug transport system fused ATPase/permease subunit